MSWETKRIAIVDDEDGKLLSIVESTDEPWIYGIVVLNPDGTDI